jgi:DNA modification methylase
MEWEDYKEFLLTSFSGFTGHSVYICCDFRIYPLIVEAIIKNGWILKHCIVWVKNVWGLGKRYRFQHEFIVYASQKDAPFFGDRSQSDVWEIDVDRSKEHNTPKPVALICKAMHNSSNLKNIILDLFGGSGSTLIACEKLNRKCFMMELDEHYCDVIVKRWEEYTGKSAERVN